MSNDNADKIKQHEIENAIFDGQNFGSIKPKVSLIFWADMPKNITLVFEDGYVLQIWRQERTRTLDYENFLYRWNLNVVSDYGEEEESEAIEPSLNVFWGSGDVEVPATVKVEELAKKVMLEALNAVYIKGDTLPENSEQLILQEEMERLYGLMGPFYLITNEEEADQTWIRGEFGLQSSIYPQR